MLHQDARLSPDSTRQTLAPRELQGGQAKPGRRSSVKHTQTLACGARMTFIQYRTSASPPGGAGLGSTAFAAISHPKEVEPLGPLLKRSLRNLPR